MEAAHVAAEVIRAEAVVAEAVPHTGEAAVVAEAIQEVEAVVAAEDSPEAEVAVVAAVEVLTADKIENRLSRAGSLFLFSRILDV